MAIESMPRTGSHRPVLRALTDEGGHSFSNHQYGRVDWGTHQSGHDRSVDDSQPIQAMDLAVLIDHRRQSLERLQRYPWPGNVRELEHIIERAVLLADGEVLTVNWQLGTEEPAWDRGHEGGTPQPLTTLHEMERAYIAEVLRHTGGRIAGTGGLSGAAGLVTSNFEFNTGTGAAVEHQVLRLSLP